MQKSYRRTVAACYSVNVTMSVIGNLSPLLFLTFHELYDISYSLLGTLVLINFCTQLTVDLIFSFFSHKFNIPLTVRLTPIIAIAGLLLTALAPVLFPNAVYLGLVLGTVVSCAASGLCEVLISPVIAAIPAENPDHEMSKLHSVYAWGVVGMVVVATVFLLLVDHKYWQWLVALMTLVPITATILFARAPIPQMQTPEKTSGAINFLKDKGVWLCILAIFLGGAAECTMAQWASGYLEQALGLPKVLGDLLGVALFAFALGFGRSLFSKIGKYPSRAILWGAIGATACYLIAALSPFAIVGLLGCAFTGFCVSMMWPGSLLVASDRYPAGGVLIFALMAAGGDMGASVGPQLVGMITDFAILTPSISSFADSLGLAPEQLGMRLGILLGSLFPMVAIFVYGYFRKQDKKKLKESAQ
ncbi:MAG: MFS transporter [Ruminococcaceae bacterium]|nr:MFS transporter [Oscillospiraceae bacterium]